MANSILVTGAAGFIGSNFVRWWIEQPSGRPRRRARPAHVRRRPAQPRRARRAARRGRHRRPRARRSGTLAEEQIDVVVNFAAESHNSLAVLDPGRFFRTNVIGTQTLLRGARSAHGVKRFHHVSTCEVYGDLPLDTDETFTEESPYRPRTPYNASKAAADHAVRAYHETFEPADHDHELLEQLRAAAVPREGHPALRHERARRQASCRCTRRRRTGASGSTSTTTAARSSSCSSAGATARRTTSARASRSRSRRSPTSCSSSPASRESLKTIVPDRPGHDRRYLLDSSKLRRELGWEPADRRSRTACARRSSGTARTATGGSRSRSGRRCGEYRLE